MKNSIKTGLVTFILIYSTFIVQLIKGKEEIGTFMPLAIAISLVFPILFSSIIAIISQNFKENNFKKTLIQILIIFILFSAFLYFQITTTLVLEDYFYPFSILLIIGFYLAQKHIK